MHKPNIFYVDDDPRSRLLLTSILRDLRFEVTAIDDAKNALAMMDAVPFDVIVLNYKLREMTGSDLAREIRAFFPHAPIVLLVGNVELSAKDLAHVDAYCAEGTTLDELVLTIKSVIPQVLIPANFAGRAGMWASST